MEQNQARDILRSLRSELAEANAVVAAAQRRVATLEKLVAGYVELFPDLADPEPGEVGEPPVEERHPRGQDAVLKVMQSIEHKNAYWTVPKMVAELDRRGWQPETKGNPANAVRTALDRLAERDERVKKGRGGHGHVVWYWQGEGYPPPRFAGDAATNSLPSWRPPEGLGNLAPQEVMP